MDVNSNESTFRNVVRLKTTPSGLADDPLEEMLAGIELDVDQQQLEPSEEQVIAEQSKAKQAASYGDGPSAADYFYQQLQQQMRDLELENTVAKVDYLSRKLSYYQSFLMKKR